VCLENVPPTIMTPEKVIQAVIMDIHQEKIEIQRTLAACSTYIEENETTAAKNELKTARMRLETFTNSSQRLAGVRRQIIDMERLKGYMQRKVCKI